MDNDSQGDHRFVVGDCELWVTSRSLADLGTYVDTLVSSDDNYLSHGGGVSYALWHTGGEDHIGADVAAERGNRALGDIVVTRAGRLKAKTIFHAITIDFDSNRRLTQSQLRDVFARVFALADEREDESVGLPLLASGGGRITPEVSASLLARALQDYLASPSQLRRIVVRPVIDLTWLVVLSHRWLRGTDRSRTSASFPVD